MPEKSFSPEICKTNAISSVRKARAFLLVVLNKSGYLRFIGDASSIHPDNTDVFEVARKRGFLTAGSSLSKLVLDVNEHLDSLRNTARQQQKAKKALLERNTNAANGKLGT